MQKYRIHRSHRLAVLATVLALYLLVAWPLAAQTKSITHLTYASHALEWSQYLQVMAARFEAETGIHVDVELGPGVSAYREQVLVRTAGGVAPDVMDFNPAIGAPLVQQGLFEDLRPYVERDGIVLSERPPVVIEGMTAPDGTMWGFPVSVFPVPVYFNVDMFSQAGLANPVELGDGWTWETYLESARRLTLRNADGVAYQFGTIDQRFRWQQPIHQAGGQVYDRNVFPTESRFNTPEVLAGINFRHQMWQEGLIATTGGVWYGNVALTMIDGPTIVNRWTGDFEMSAAVQPKGPASRSAEVNPDGFQIHIDSKNKDIAWQWIKYLVDDVERQVEFATITGRIPSLRGAMLRFSEIPRRLPGNWYALILTAFDPDAHTPYVIPNTAVTSAVNTGLTAIWQGQVAPQVGLQQIHEQVMALLVEQ